MSIRAHPEWNVHAVLIERAGRLVYEEYFSGKDERWGQPLGVVTFTRGTLHDLRSVTKSVVSALVGIASSSGAIPSLDAPLLDYFPEYKDLDVPERRRITIRHALSMSAGFEWNEDVPYTDPKNDEIVMNRSPDPIHYVLARPIVSAPGTSWRYNGGTTQVLGDDRPTRDQAAARRLRPRDALLAAWHHGVRVVREPRRRPVGGVGTPAPAARPRQVRFAVSARRSLERASDSSQRVGP